MPAPLTGPADGATGVSQVRFLNGDDGWAFGPELFATHDGGHTWAQVATNGLRVTDLETVGHRAFALFASCTGTGAPFAAQCTAYSLYSSPASSDDWTPVGPSTSGLGRRGRLVRAHRDARLPAGAGPDALRRAGRRQRALAAVKQIPCPVGTPPADGQPTGALLAAANATNLVLACASSSAPGSQQAKQVFTSADGGIAWQNAVAAPALGLATSVAASPSGTYVLATTQGLDVLPAGSATWQAATLDGHAAGRRVRLRGHDDRPAGHRAARQPRDRGGLVYLRRREDLGTVPRQLGRAPGVPRFSALSGFSGFSGSPRSPRSPG